MTHSIQLRHTSYTHQHISASRGQHPWIESEQPDLVQLESAKARSQKNTDMIKLKKHNFYLASKQEGGPLNYFQAGIR